MLNRVVNHLIISGLFATIFAATATIALLVEEYGLDHLLK